MNTKCCAILRNSSSVSYRGRRSPVLSRIRWPGRNRFKSAVATYRGGDRKQVAKRLPAHVLLHRQGHWPAPPAHSAAARQAVQPLRGAQADVDAKLPDLRSRGTAVPATGTQCRPRRPSPLAATVAAKRMWCHNQGRAGDRLQFRDKQRTPDNRETAHACHGSAALQRTATALLTAAPRHAQYQPAHRPRLTGRHVHSQTVFTCA